ncbi:glycosyltransferase [Candidatus Atribacteria bacterium 1244-E10-H5-B2]|nr:MAG: glycosyltransferase [Candidatus Atribacteria bacterium 1244-E10-H5-B2]
MKILLATLYDDLKTYCLKQFAEGVKKLNPQPDKIVFVVDRKKVFPILKYVFPDSVILTMESYEDMLDAVGNGRNIVIDYARKNKFDYIFFLDADVVCHPETIRMLIDINEGISGGLVCRRCEPYTSMKPWFNNYIKRQNGTSWYPEGDFQPNEIIDVDWTGNDCMMISKEVFNSQDYRWRITSPREAEDFSFCQDATKRGFKVKVHASVWTEHMGLWETFSTKEGKIRRIKIEK